MSTELDRISELAKEDAKRQFCSIAHMITFGALYAAFRGLRKKASAGVDGVTYEEYERDVAGNLQTLHERFKDGKYQAQPLRRVYIPKENGKQRPISIPALEDKIVQKAMVEILNAIYEQDFLDCSYGFRPGRGQHQALDEVGRVICTRPTGWVLEIDVTAYFDSIVRDQLMEMIEQRVSDRSVLRLIRKWIQVGVIEEGRLLVSETGTGQGQTISPLLANIYLHHVLDAWFENEVKPRLRGAAHEIRFADDAVLCFQYKRDAQRVMEVLPKRFVKYGLTIHPEKTRLLEFGRYAEENAKRRGKKPATFDFLGHTHVCARSRKGKFTVHVRTMKKRFRRGLTAIAEWCQENRHRPVEEQQKTLNAKLRGHYQYYGRPTNYRSVWQFFREVRRIWHKWLSRRTRGNGMTWEKYAAILGKHPLLMPRILHSWHG
ncbi:MAG: group II intron reverse transcriptase/maturase, partial [Acidobacteria bacterium]